MFLCPGVALGARQSTTTQGSMGIVLRQIAVIGANGYTTIQWVDCGKRGAVPGHGRKLSPVMSVLDGKVASSGGKQSRLGAV